jgi:hypothetical protein
LKILTMSNWETSSSLMKWRRFNLDSPKRHGFTPSYAANHGCVL